MLQGWPEECTGTPSSIVKGPMNYEIVSTRLVGYGVPTAFQLGGAHYDGYVACKTPAELRQWVQTKQMMIMSSMR